MYRYDEFDHDFVQSRVKEFSAQVMRRLDGKLTEDEFKPLRLMNGLYLQLHAYMLRVAIPYGTLSSTQMRMLADISTKYDKGYGHFTTRQNIQYNWPQLVDVPNLLQDLASVEMHALQTSGNCIRNITSDPWAGVAADEVIDPRPICELLRQWSSLHPEFAFLPRKFKFAVTAATQDRAAVKTHDIGIIIKRNEQGELGYEILAGGGQGRTPYVAQTIRDFVPEDDLLAYIEAMLRIYNLHGRRDNKYKARIKILLNEMGVEAFREAVEQEFANYPPTDIAVPKAELDRIETYFAAPDYQLLPEKSEALNHARSQSPDFDAWCKHNLGTHKIAGYSIVNISLKEVGKIPGDATEAQMNLVADLADEFSLQEIRVTHRQNLVLPYVKKDDLYPLWQKLVAGNLAVDNYNLATDMISCPGMDYCSLATARSIPVAQNIAQYLTAKNKQHEFGKLHINISGCINACGHHHVGNIGILGLDKKGEEYYQITLGGSSDHDASVGEIAGPGFSFDEVPQVVEKVLDIYLELKQGEETFLQTYRRVGMSPFKEQLYATA